MASGSDSALSIPPQLLQGLFDYAGLFPPAALSMEAAVAEYLTHKTGPEAWLVGPFVVPATQLQEMEDAFAAQAPGAAPDPAAAVGITLLPRSADTLQEDLQAFATMAGGPSRTSSIPYRLAAVEFRLPPDALQHPTAIDAVLDRATQAVLDGAEFLSEEPLPVYVELPRPFTPAQLATYMGGLSSRTAPPSFRAKIRCGGDSIAAYPSAGELALFIHAAHRAGCAFKATAGLHHPFPVPDPATGATMHGFINVFAASVLHSVHVLPLLTLENLLSETDPSAFSLSASHIGWRSWQATAADVDHVRRTFAMGIGSCSITEPLEDLSSLGYSIS